MIPLNFSLLQAYCVAASSRVGGAEKVIFPALCSELFPYIPSWEFSFQVQMTCFLTILCLVPILSNDVFPYRPVLSPHLVQCSVHLKTGPSFSPQHSIITDSTNRPNSHSPLCEINE